MSNLLEQASLVMIPSGYKEDIVYSEIPINGAGDLSFTRASNGTRINSAGLVEVCPWNLVDNSNSFTSGAWVLQEVTTTSGQADPLGGSFGWRFNETTATNQHRFYYSFIAFNTGVITQSIYVKSLGRDQIFIGANSNSENFIFTFSTETISSVTGFTSTSATSVGGGWYRLTATFFAFSPINCLFVQGYNGGLSYAGDTSKGFYAFGGQLNIGSTAKPYFPTTDRLNVPRLTYQNGGGGCPSLLLEKQSTNLLSYSEQFDNAYWDKGNGSITANATTSPDGTTNADKFVEDSSNNVHYFGDNTTSATSGQTVTFTIFAKASERSWIAMRIYNGSGSVIGWYNIGSGTLGTIGGGGTASITAMGNGWYRCALTVTMISSSVCLPFVFSSTGDTILSYTGTNGSGFFVWGAQAEISSYPTSYIPSTSSSATRVADVATVNLPNTNMTFTAYLELDEASLGTAAGDWFSIYSNVSSLGRAYGYANQFGFADAYSLGVASGAKMVWKQESGSTAKIFKGGALVGTSTTGTYTDPFNRLRMDGALLDKPVKIKQFVFFDNALTDAECIQLTA